MTPEPRDGGHGGLDNDGFKILDDPPIEATRDTFNDNSPLYEDGDAYDELGEAQVANDQNSLEYTEAYIKESVDAYMDKEEVVPQNPSVSSVTSMKTSVEGPPPVSDNHLLIIKVKQCLDEKKTVMDDYKKQLYDCINKNPNSVKAIEVREKLYKESKIEWNILRTLYLELMAEFNFNGLT